MWGDTIAIHNVLKKINKLNSNQLNIKKIKSIKIILKKIITKKKTQKKRKKPCGKNTVTIYNVLCGKL
jgi:hypothetical protein